MRTEDGHIVRRCLDGDAAAFGLLVDKYKGSIYALAYSKLHNFHDAEDVAQEAFIKAYQKLRTLRRWDNFLAWLYAITSNLCKMLIRARANRPDREFVEDQSPKALADSPASSYPDNPTYKLLHEALDSLPETYSQILTLYYLGGMNGREIATFLGKSPATIRQRLSRARSQLRKEMLAMMDATFKEQKLQASFTIRIVEAVKRIRIHPVPRTSGLPWGLSLATGIIFTALSLIPQPGILNRVATGSPLPGETMVVENGEIPVDILKISQLPILAGKQGDGDGVEPELPDPQIASLATVDSEADTRMQAAASDEGIIIDTETGVEYTKILTLTGKNDVIQGTGGGFGLSPNGKFLINEVLVVPLGEDEPFDLVAMPALRGSWSPDGEKITFNSGGAIWIITVSPETGRPMGPAKKLLDGEYWYEQDKSWSPDSEKIVFERKDKENQGDIWTISVRDGALDQITDDPIREGRPVWSPDGKTIAYNRGYEVRIISAKGGVSRKIADKGRDRPCKPISWLPDSSWLMCRMWGKLWFFHPTDGREFSMALPGEVGNFLSWSPDGKKMLSYRPSYVWRSALKVVSVSGGASFELGRQLPLWTLWPYNQYWSPDSRMIVTEGRDKDGDTVFWIVPLAGGDPFLLELDVSVPGKPVPLSLSPDCRKLRFSVKRSDNTHDLWVVPVSLKDGRTTGSAVMVFSGKDERIREGGSLSPDGTKLAVIYKGDVWIASVEGGEFVQLTKTPERKLSPYWAPGGEMIAYEAYHSENEQPLMVISASGGEPRKLWDEPNKYVWSPDGKELALVSEGLILAIPIAGGETRRIADLKELGVDEAHSLCWSPDGRHLAFAGDNREGPGPIFTVPVEGGKATKLAADDPDEKYFLSWSPDGKWISYDSDGHIKTRPGGEIWEADLSELLSGGERKQ